MKYIFEGEFVYEIKQVLLKLFIGIFSPEIWKVKNKASIIQYNLGKNV